MGVIIDASKRASIDKYVQQAKEEGAEVVQACATTIPKSGKGLFYPLDPASVYLCADRSLPYYTSQLCISVYFLIELAGVLTFGTPK